MPGRFLNDTGDDETSVLELRHHNYAYSIDQITNGLTSRNPACTVGELINYLKTINPNAIVVISSDHSTVGQCYIKDIRRWDYNGYVINDDSDQEE